MKTNIRNLDPDKRVHRATLEATHLMGLATGQHLAALRAMDDPLAAALARAQQAKLRAGAAGS